MGLSLRYAKRSKDEEKEGMIEMTKEACGHPLSEDGITCIFWTRCEGNTEVEIYKGLYTIALSNVDGDESRARSMTEAGMRGLHQGGHIYAS